MFLVRDCDLKAPKGKSKNQWLRETIMKAEDQLNMFPDISVDTLPRPSNVEEVSCDLAFMKEFEKIKERLLQKANQNSVKGPILADLIGKYTESIQSGNYPKIETRLACIDNYLKTSANQLVEEFRKEMKEEMERNPLPIEIGLPVVFQKDLDTLKSSECNGFDKSLVGCYLRIFRPMYCRYLRDVEMYAPKSVRIHIEYLMSKIAVFSYDRRKDELKAIRIIGGHLQDFDEKNSTNSQIQCNELSQSLLHDLRSKMDSFPEYSLKHFGLDSKRAITTLKESAKGPAKEEVFEKFKSEVESLETALDIKQRNFEHDTQLRKLQNELSEANGRAAKFCSESTTQAATIERLSEKNKELIQKNECLVQDRQNLLTEKRELIEKVQTLEVEVMKYTRENEQLRRENEENRKPSKPSKPNLARDGLQHDSIKIEWSPLLNFSEDETYICRYDVEVRRTGKNPQVYEANEPMLKVSNLRFKTSYQFRVRGVHVERLNQKKIIGDYSDPLEDVETKDYIPSAPGNLQTTERCCHRMTIAWDPSNDPRTAEATEGYVITYRKRGSSRQSERSFDIGKDKREYQLINLQRYRTYIIRVGVKNSSGHVEYSTEHEFSTRMQSQRQSQNYRQI